jgi:hypothetical protein
VTAVQRVKEGRFKLMRILGLPLPGFFVLIVVPAIIVAYQFYYCWQVYTGRRD